MLNGFHGTQQEWDRMEGPLRCLDESLQEYAQRHEFILGVNYHNWPERSFRRTDQGIDRLIQIYLVDPVELTFNLWVCATQDRRTARYWKERLLLEGVPIGALESDLVEFLDQAREQVSVWSKRDVEFATKLRPLPD